mmetsp:Transcript_33203/g.43756  ORF Transcript_33203/g.43756 Transcript_33203/m.43756 type:complete len:221 (+) Transcript_33203:325-987(+)
MGISSSSSDHSLTANAKNEVIGNGVNETILGIAVTEQWFHQALILWTKKSLVVTQLFSDSVIRFDTFPFINETSNPFQLSSPHQGFEEALFCAARGKSFCDILIIAKRGSLKQFGVTVAKLFKWVQHYKNYLSEYRFIDNNCRDYISYCYERICTPSGFDPTIRGFYISGHRSWESFRLQIPEKYSIKMGSREGKVLIGRSLSNISQCKKNNQQDEFDMH